MTVAVRELAAFVHRRGDLHYRYDRATTAVEGIGAQRRAQRGRPDSHRREVAVEATLERHGVALTVRGRIDGFDPEAGLIEEFKTTRSDVDRLHAHLGHLHLAQLRLYAGLVDEERPSWRLRLTYLRPDGESSRQVEETVTREDAADYLARTVDAYASWLAGRFAHTARRDAVLEDLAFPFDDFRDHQRRMARGAFRAFRDAGQLLVEAPTGSGKTVSMVYSALRAMGAGRVDRTVFLTARGTGQRAAEEALARCGAESPQPGSARGHASQENHVSAVTVTAKDRICFEPGTPCDPAHCGYARGYYDRMPPAREALLAQGLVARERVEAVAREHAVCPFELSLDTAAWTDVVICDYNYVFDPVVRLRRLVTHASGSAGLLVDEAHQLAARTSDMLSVSMERRACRNALEDAPAGLSKRIRSVDRALLKLRREEEDGPIAQPAALLRALERLLATAAEVDLAASPAARTFLGDCYRFVAGAGWFDETDYRYLLATEGREISVRMTCLSPAAHIADVLDGFHGAVRFSGTLSPPALFQALHGQPDARSGRVDAGFPEDALGVFVVPDVSTYYRDRARTLDALVGAVRAVTEAAPGNYLVALPSFAYLDLLAPALAAVSPFRVAAQRPGMADDERAVFLAELSGRDAPCIGAVVMGGVFAESVDFDGGALRGVIVVGPGLPPPSTERDLVAERYGDDGFTVAYLQPAMAKVVQAAGRAVRGPDDRGVVVLVDPRFTESRCQAFFPAHWRPERVRAAALGDAVAAFWDDPEDAASYGPSSTVNGAVLR
ncbi:MAG: ATP-dependent DNA helicase [Gammaproteobacteria bacterium]|nr:ATP-dependent DNA helicase [Gammaproteobacteria bacterium]